MNVPNDFHAFSGLGSTFIVQTSLELALASIPGEGTVESEEMVNEGFFLGFFSLSSLSLGLIHNLFPAPNSSERTSHLQFFSLLLS